MLKITIDLMNVEFDPDAKPQPKVGTMMKWIHTRDGEGVCAECAPFIGVIKPIEDWDDIPPLHPHCYCELMPLEIDEAEAQMSTEEEFGWMDRLSLKDLAAIVGSERAALVAAGKVTARGLYAEDGARLLTMKELTGGGEMTQARKSAEALDKIHAANLARINADRAKREADRAAKRAASKRKRG